jgi:hypothetical protein
MPEKKAKKSANRAASYSFFCRLEASATAVE